MNEETRVKLLNLEIELSKHMKVSKDPDANNLMNRSRHAIHNLVAAVAAKDAGAADAGAADAGAATLLLNDDSAAFTSFKNAPLFKVGQSY